MREEPGVALLSKGGAGTRPDGVPAGGALLVTLGLAMGVVACVLCMAGPVQADGFVLYVVPGGPESGACGSWAAACGLEYALDQAVAGDEIWVAQGLYTPTNGSEPRERTFELKEGVALYGGLQGSETSRDERDWETYVTVLSGDIGGDDATDANGVVTDVTKIGGSNVYHVVSAIGVTETAELDGFVITAGHGDDTDDHGGGLYCESASPILRNLTFQGNRSRTGGGMYNWKGWPTLTRVTFVGNWASYEGGGLYSYGASATLIDVTFRSNSAPQGGGMVNRATPQLSVSDASFVDNEATDGAGGGMYNSASTLGSVTAISVTDTVFERNTASATGGGMANRLNVSPTLVNVGFYGNVAETGGGAGMHSNNSSASRLHNVVFVGNWAAQHGGAMRNAEGSDAILVNVTMICNKSDDGSGGMYNTDSDPLISNTIVALNGDPVGVQIINTDGSSPTITHSDIQGAFSGGVWDASLGKNAGGNMDDEADFVRLPDPGSDGVWGTEDDDYGDLRLKPISKVIDKGDNGSLPPDELDIDGDGDRDETLPHDYDGNRRVTGGVVDMGAYEASVLLGISKKVDGPGTGPLAGVALDQGDRLTYTLAFSNAGAYSATGIVLTDVLPAGILDTQVMSSGTPITLVAGTSYVWEVGTLLPAGSGKLTVTGQLADCTAPGVGVVNTATIWAKDLSNPLASVATATFTVTNQAPLAADDAYSVTAGLVLMVAAPGVLVNDSDIDCQSLNATVVSPPGRGTLDLDLDGSLVYTPGMGSAGPVTFDYQASDGELSDQAQVTVNVLNAAPIAEDDTYKVTQGMVLRVGAPGVLGNDLDANGDALTATLIAPPVSGTLELALDGSLVFTPEVAHTGPVTFVYEASDGDLVDQALVTVAVEREPSYDVFLPLVLKTE